MRAELVRLASIGLRYPSGAYVDVSAQGCRGEMVPLAFRTKRQSPILQAIPLAPIRNGDSGLPVYSVGRAAAVREFYRHVLAVGATRLRESSKVGVSISGSEVLSGFPVYGDDRIRWS